MKAYAHKTGHSVRHPSGAALIITLAMLILVSFVVVAFLGRSTREAVLVGGAVGGQKADLLANSVAELIIADLKNEMRAGSTENTTNGVAIMEPDTAATAMPSQARLASGAGFENLIKQSGASAGMFGTNTGTLGANAAPYNKNNVTELIPTACATQTTTDSVDGRTVSAARWGAPQLLVGGSFGATQVPNWILMDRSGIAPSQTWNDAFKDRTPTNDRYIIGRFAYNIYDVSGLLDINVAGYPSVVTNADSSRKGSLAMAAIENIAGIGNTTNANTFVSIWRNKLSGGTSTNYLSYIGLSNNTSNSFYNLGPKYGFQKVTSNATSSDNRLLSRQDLIKLATNGGNGIAIGALPYLTHFSRTVSAPTWSPSTANSTNVSLTNVRVTGNFTRAASGEPAIIGEPLLKYRFPLSRLAGIGRTGVNTDNKTTLIGGILDNSSNATVQRDFGLVWSGSQWIYAGPTGSTVLTAIDNLTAISGREPNFFELLKAAILSGSLGKSFGDGLSAATANQTSLDIDKDRQIIQIGLNIIDQYDGDSYPTVCSFNGTLSGIENLPYLNRVFMHFYRPTGNSTTDVTKNSSNVNAYWIGEVWYPHRGTSPAAGVPTNFRLRVDGVSLPKSSNSTSAISSASNNRSITFTNPGSSDPKFLIPLMAAAADPSVDEYTDNSSRRITGIYAGTLVNVPSTPKPKVSITSSDGIDFFLEYQDGTKWVPYQTWSKISPDSLEDDQDSLTSGVSLSPGCFIQGADPRSNRFGLYGGILPSGSRNSTWTAPALPPANLSVGLPSSTSNFTYTGTLNLTDLSKNLGNSTTRYTDLDGILRSGDATYSTQNSTYPLHSTGTNSRPVILNRPFRSVADLGYAFRDLPFKTLDLFTANSADSALLDVFCVNESPVSGVTAGVINPNTRHASVIQAVLVNSLKNELNIAPATSRLTSTNEALAIANTTVSMTATTPVRNTSEVASRLGPANLTLFPLTDRQIKAYRESVVRALADVSNTRTWNVMVDLVVQSGRYASAATDVDKFTVDGERRMWVHLAIDRYTGQVIARSTEIVNE